MASILSCTPHTEDNLRLEIKRILSVLDNYRWMIDAYVSDFFVKDHWDRLPLSWQRYLDALSFQQLAGLLTGESWLHTSSLGSVSPLSLLALKACTRTHSLRRRCVDLDNQCVLATMRDCLHSHLSSGESFSCGQVQGHGERTPQTPQGEAPFSKSPNFKNGQLLEMEHIFRKHVKPKKQHEIQRLAKVISWLSGQTGSSHVIDVGAGLGHLSRLLTFAHGLKVTTVEASDGHAPKASEFDRELEKDILKKITKHSLDQQETSSLSGQTTVPPSDNLPSHVVHTVHADITTQQFLRLVLHSQSQADLHSQSPAGPLSKWGSASAESSTHSVVTNQTAVDGVGVQVPGVQAESKHKQLTVAVDCDEAGCGNSHTSGDSVGTQTVVVPHQLTAATASHHTGRQVPDSSVYGWQAGDVTGDTPSSDVTGDTPSSDVRGETPPFDVTGETPPPDVKLTASKGQGIAVHSTTGKTNDTEKTTDSERQMDINHSEAGDGRVLSVMSQTETGQDSGAETASEQEEDSGLLSGLVLTGLHACGDLTATLLRVFVNCPAVDGLVSVGCCYMKLSCCSSSGPTDGRSETGYPMSHFTSSLKNHHLTYEAREMACHFADAYAKRLKDNPPHLKIHGYRAALQYVVTCVHPDFQTGVVRLVLKRGADVPFVQYAQQCFHKLGIDATQVPEDVMIRGESLAAQWRRVVAFYTLRLSLAPLVETVILLDRMLFLAEHGINSVLLPVFDSSLSPRNFALIACKH
ncbi:hypothetical protein BaRGS_00027390 [Batillaria attramentaria]|uniref:Methyltransferase domain-containing protein n=1 Tax=Batillaria attramentaria TaxID=370345 RepID=A0ABD0K1M6_9CAEN